ncbi:hypothetical protein HDU98_002459 [Podochytrium sp. JEL0797]|nr:hypothetical protein HDU98_002459 [Podochytrium sp. JEL0797]
MYSLEEIDQLLSGLDDNLNTDSPPPLQQQQCQQHQIQIPFSSLLHATKNPPMLTPLSSKGNSPSARLFQQLANEQKQPITPQVYSESFFNYHIQPHSFGARDNALGGMFPAAEMPMMGSCNVWDNYMHMSMLSKPCTEQKGPNAIEAAAIYFQMDPFAGGTSHTNNFHAQLENSYMQFPNKSTLVDDSSSFSHDTFINSNSQFTGSSSISASSFAVSPFHNNNFRQPPIPPWTTTTQSSPQHACTPIIFQREHNFSPALDHTAFLDVPIYSSDLMSYPTVQPSEIYYQPVNFSRSAGISDSSRNSSSPNESSISESSESLLLSPNELSFSESSVSLLLSPIESNFSESSASLLSPSESSSSESAASLLLPSEKKRVERAVAAAAEKALKYSMSMEISVATSTTKNVVAASAAEGGVHAAGTKKRGPRGSAKGGAAKKAKNAAEVKERNAVAESSVVSPVDGPESDEHLAKKSKNAEQAKKRANHKPDITARLFKWLMEHQNEPYPNEEQKKSMAANTGLTHNQINDWFINARRSASALAGLTVAQAPTTNMQTGCVTNYDATIDYFPEKIDSANLTNLEYTYSKNYKTIVNKFSKETIVLYQCGTPKPTVAGATQIISVPIQNLTISSTTAVTFLELLNERQSIKYTTSSTLAYISSPCIQEMVAKDPNAIIEADDKNMTRQIEQIDTTDVFLHYMNSVAANVTNAVSFPASADPGVKGRLEWIGFLGSFFNKEALANNVSSAIMTNYAQLAAAIPSSAAKPLLSWVNYQAPYSAAYPAAWQINQAAYQLDYSKAAGASVFTPPASTDPTIKGESLQQTTYSWNNSAGFLAAVAPLDIVIDQSFYNVNSSSFMTSFMIASADTDKYKFLSKKAVYMLNREISSVNGGNNWFEAGNVLINVVLADIISATNPGVLPKDYARTFIRNVFDEAQVVLTASQCKSTTEALAVPIVKLGAAATTSGALSMGVSLVAVLASVFIL